MTASAFLRLSSDELFSAAEGGRWRIVVDLSQVTYFGSVFVSFLLRCHSQARKHGSEIVLAGASEPARELLKLLDLETLWAIYDTRQEAMDALGGSD